MGKIVYTKLLSLMSEKGLTTYKIRKEKIISEGTLQSIRQGKSVTTDSIASLCQALECQPGDILEYVPDESNHPKGLADILKSTPTVAENAIKAISNAKNQ